MEEGENPARGRAKSSPGPPGCRGAAASQRTPPPVSHRHGRGGWGVRAVPTGPLRGVAAASQRTPPPVSHRHGRGLGGEGVPAHLAARGVRRFRTDAPLVTSGRGRGLGECRHRPAQTRTRPCGRARAGMGREGIEFAAGFGGVRRSRPCLRQTGRFGFMHAFRTVWGIGARPVDGTGRARKTSGTGARSAPGATLFRNGRLRRWPRTPPPRSGPRPPRARSRPSARRRRRWRGGGAGRRRSRGWPPAAGASRRRRGRRRGGR